ncbi:unnamed protein product [Heligmosomoides polygyrus]|uniref:ZM domain-containing protein n=1 Tax=Heligmosomoides polygyrus TaxID=6339 RepID=A0A183GTK9_HELPZ|nr:unnamed protein product [Heligmosomoides polygyrus]
MSDRTFIKSVYYIADSKKVNEPDLQVDSRETAQDASPVLQNTAHHQIRVDPAPTKKAALPRVPEHYFAPKPVIDKPLIESAYCYTANTVHYYADGPKRNEAQQFLDEEIQSSSPVAATLPTTLGLVSS